MSIGHLYFKFDGRIGRFTYIVKGLLVLFALTILFSFIDKQIVSGPGEYGAVAFIWMLLNIWMSTAIAVKRLHDLDHSGWWLLWALIPILGPYI